MSKVSVIFEDDRDGLVGVHVEFDPPIDNKSDVQTGAQMLAMEFLDMLSKRKEK